LYAHNQLFNTCKWMLSIRPFVSAFSFYQNTRQYCWNIYSWGICILVLMLKISCFWSRYFVKFFQLLPLLYKNGRAMPNVVYVKE
ncbi:MAG: hypothetical protein LW711_17215, partial [Saprospiraceae bacterium]|nr:hypothetical protein [Saprospiraceae bacterium]